MKMTVITEASGNVVSTYLHPDRPGKDDPTLHIGGGPGHTSHEIDVPAEFGQVESAAELHKLVADRLARG